MEKQEKLKQNLIQTASEFAIFACQSLSCNKLHQFCVGAACSAELLCKAVLVQLHPSLISSKDFDSLLNILGFTSYLSERNIKITTISGIEAVKRCSRIIPEISKFKREIEELIEIRNGTLHLGMNVDSIAPQLINAFYKLIKIVAKFLNIEIIQVIPDSDYLELLEAEKDKFESDIEDRVARKIFAARKLYKGKYGNLSPEEVKNIVLKIRRPPKILGEASLLERCPACGAWADLEGHEIKGETLYDENGQWRIITVYPFYFYCPYCELELEGEEELEAAHLPTEIQFEERINDSNGDWEP